MATTEEYKAINVSLVWTLTELGLLDKETAERNDDRWRYELDHWEHIWALAEKAWEQLPWWRRLLIGFTPGKVSWKIGWRRKHDPWRTNNGQS